MQTFKEIFHVGISRNKTKLITQPGKNCQTYHGKMCTLCPAINLAYDVESQIKNEAFQKFWAENNLDGKVHPLITSPRGRNYRTNSKRRAFLWNGDFMLGLTEQEEDGPIKPLNVMACAIEPELHAKIYDRLFKFFSSREGAGLSEFLNYTILKGNYETQALILNLRRFTGYERPHVTRLSKLITREFPSVVSIFVAENEHSKYYLETLRMNRIFGEKEITEFAGKEKLLYLPEAFSQTNSSMIDAMVDSAKNLLKPKSNEFFLDLYCGYGLFALSFAPLVAKTLALEIANASFSSAISNAKRIKSSARFTKTDINEKAIEKLSPLPENTIVLLDPPRQGTATGVIEALADNNVARVLHIFCEADIIPDELRRWKKSGYMATEVVPLDMFPATEHIETMVLLNHQ